MQIFHLSNLPFAGLIAASFFFLFFQGLLEHHDAPDLEAHELHLPWLGFLNFGNIPLSLLLILFLFHWGACGLVLHGLAVSIFRAYHVWELLLSLLLSTLPAVVLTRLLSGTFARLFQDSSAITTPDELVGCSGVIISGSVPPEGDAQMGRAHLYTAQGTLLQIRCQTEVGCVSPTKNQTVFVTAYHPETRHYSVLLQESPDFFRYLSADSHFSAQASAAQSHHSGSLNAQNKNLNIPEDFDRE